MKKTNIERQGSVIRRGTGRIDPSIIRKAPLVRAGAQRQFDAILSNAAVVSDVSAVLRRARRLLASYPLRSAEAMQLAAALLACEDEPSRLPFATLDDRLADAATREGFTVVP